MIEPEMIVKKETLWQQKLPRQRQFTNSLLDAFRCRFKGKLEPLNGSIPFDGTWFLDLQDFIKCG
jgi:hypothetical protein